jgi:hypothetical protein
MIGIEEPLFVTQTCSDILRVGALAEQRGCHVLERLHDANPAIRKQNDCKCMCFEALHALLLC